MLVLGIRTNEVFEVYHKGEQLQMVFFMGTDKNPKIGIKGPKSFDINRVQLTEELRQDIGLEEKKPKKVNKLSRRSKTKNRKNFNS